MAFVVPDEPFCVIDAEAVFTRIARQVDDLFAKACSQLP